MSKFNRSLFIRNIPQPLVVRPLKAVLAAKLYDLLDWVWWKIVPGTIITVKWPRGSPRWIPMEYLNPHFDLTSDSADPNDHYRPTLEHYCGKQFVGWHWKAVVGIHNVNTYECTVDFIEIKFRFDKKQWASLLALRWG